jgi:hypothetical protein
VFAKTGIIFACEKIKLRNTWLDEKPPNIYGIDLFFLLSGVLECVNFA